MESKDESQQQAGEQGDEQFDLRFCLTQAEPTEKSVEMALYSVRSRIMSAAFARNHETLDELQHKLYDAMTAARAIPPDTTWRSYGIVAAEVLLDLVAEMTRCTRPAKKDAWARRSPAVRAVLLFLPEGRLVNADEISEKLGKSIRWTRTILSRMERGELVTLDDIGKGKERSAWCELAPAGIALQESLWLEEKRLVLR